MSRANKRWFHKRTLFQRKNSIRSNSIQGNMFSKKRTNWSMIVKICVCFVALCAIGAGAFYLFSNMPKREIAKIVVQIQDGTMYQEEELPVVEVQVSSDSDSEVIQGILEELQTDGAYKIYTEGDLTKEGQYKLLLKWSEEIEAKLSDEWKEYIKLDVKSGKVTVKNKSGEWEGDKFKKIDGTYAVNEFITFKGKEYFFDGDGNKVTGEYQMNGYTYYFSKDGAFDTEKNKIHPGKPMVALTFDDGPGAYTEELLAILEEYDSRATFFVLGQQAESFPTSIKRMKEIGCEIGNHTYSHRRLTELSEEDMKSQIDKANKVLKELTGEEAKLVRPTYGAVNSAVRKYVKYPYIMWSLDTEDWKLKDSAKITEAILSQVEDGDIILMHDIHEFTFEAMKSVIPELVNRGYQLVTVSELASTHGVVLEKETKYFEF